jgi:acyl carrier protein
MTRDEILQSVNSIFREVLDNDNINLGEETTAADVAEWDSLTHIHLVVAVEKKLKIRFTSREIRSWNNVGGMIDAIMKKMTEG